MSHSLSKIIVHTVWHIKKSSPEIRKEDRVELFKYLNGTLEEKGCVPLRINGVGNHVHVLFILSRTLSIAKIMEILKSHSSKWIKKKGLYYKNFSWQGGYGAFSVSESVIEKTVEYVKNQKEHHRKRTFQEEYKMFLQLYHIEYDEKYLFSD